MVEYSAWIALDASNYSTYQLCSMPNQPSLPRFIFPCVLARKKSCFSGSFALNKIKYGISHLMDQSSHLSVQVSFLDNEHQCASMMIRLSGSILMSCERCTQAVDILFKTESQLICVETDEQAKKIPAGYEPVMIKDDKLDLDALIEEELLLNLPVMPHHEKVDICDEFMKKNWGDTVTLLTHDANTNDSTKMPTYRAFDVLDELLK
ncbi:MAG: hypothetical protein HAW62_03085 [Endozoicomonadaceae bacterium]|nr:hypothetical protein [Endozoicomonadaceae bacterium]